MTVTAAPPAGPFAPAEPVTDDALAGPVERVAAWVAYVGLEGRYAVVCKPGVGSLWWRWAGDRWRRCDERMVRAAVRYSLDDAYYRLARRADATPRRLDRLLDPGYADGCLWSELIGVLRTTPDRLAV